MHLFSQLVACILLLSIMLIVTLLLLRNLTTLLVHIASIKVGIRIVSFIMWDKSTISILTQLLNHTHTYPMFHLSCRCYSQTLYCQYLMTKQRQI
jgi:hypothetical protein